MCLPGTTGRLLGGNITIFPSGIFAFSSLLALCQMVKNVFKHHQLFAVSAIHPKIHINFMITYFPMQIIMCFMLADT